MEESRVVVTGMSVISPIANTLTDFSEGIFEGKVGIEDIRAFDTSEYSLKHGGEVKDFIPKKHFSKLKSESFNRSTQFAVATSKLAFEMSNIDDYYDRRRIGCIFGTTMGNQQIVEYYNDKLINGKKDTINYQYGNLQANVITSAVASELDLKGPNMVIPTACAAGNYAIGYATELIKNGKADCVICGGTDAFSRACFTMFLRLGAMSPDLCRPFDANREGMIVSEGAAALVLERYDLAKKRNAKIYGEIVGYGNSCDAHHVTAPHPEGQGASLAIEKAIKNSKLNKSDIQYISAHGTGTIANDSIESLALSKVFGEEVSKIPISSIKSLIGHTMGAAAAIEAVASILTLNEDKFPVNKNVTEVDPTIKLNVIKEPTNGNVDYVLSNAFAFGGNISCVVFKRGD